MVNLDRNALEAAVLGGSFFGGGGGGSADSGLEAGDLALKVGEPRLMSIDEVAPDSALLTVSAVGAPGGDGLHAKPYHYLKAVEAFIEHSGLKVGGLITNECGGLATVNGWFQAAALGLPIVDCPCNGRAHPTGVMGSMGLHRVPGFLSQQTAVGGYLERGTYVEIFVKGSLEKAAAIARQAAVQAGGLVAVARNPVSADYASKNGAPGAIAHCIKIGRAMLEASGQSSGEQVPGKRSTGRRTSGERSFGEQSSYEHIVGQQPTAKGSAGAMIEAAASAANGRVVCSGSIVAKHLETRGGFDVGTIGLDGEFELVFWNEYMTLDYRGERLGTFPDLIATLDTRTGCPISTAEAAEGQEVAVILVPKEALILGAGVKDPALYRSAEEVTGKEIIRYAFG